MSKKAQEEPLDKNLDDFLKMARLEKAGEMNTDKCRICKQKVKEKQRGLRCDNCEYWFHGSCEEVSEEEYKYLTLMEDIAWYCKDCKKVCKEALKQNARLKEENSYLKRDNDMLKLRLVKLEEQMRSLQQEMKRGVLSDIKNEIRDFMTDMSAVMKDEIVKITKKEIMAEITEREEHQRRLKNLIVYGLEESKRNNGRDREIDDKEMCKELFTKELNVKEAQVVNTVRLGKRAQCEADENEGNFKPRPLLVELTQAKHKFELLKRCKQLRNSEEFRFRKAIIAPDLTKKEREADHKLRLELKEKQQRGERGWFISKGKLQRNFQM